MLRFLEVMPVVLMNTMLASAVVAAGTVLAVRALGRSSPRAAHLLALGAIVVSIAWGIGVTAAPSGASDLAISRLASVLLGAIWLIVAGMLLMRELLSYRQLARRQATWRREIGALSEFGWPANFPIFWTDDDGPAAVAGWKAGLALPEAWFGGLPPTAKRALLAHELAHLKFRDAELNIAARLARACLWPVLPLWWLYRETSVLREMAADRVALNGGAMTPGDLASFLVDASQSRGSQPGVSFTSYSAMRRRVLALLNTPRSAVVGGCLAIAALSATGITLAQLSQFTNDVLRPAVLAFPVNATDPYREAATSLNAVFARTKFRNYSVDEAKLDDLQRLGPAVVAPLRDALAAPDATTRAAAAWVAGELGERRLLADVNKLRTDENELVRDLAVFATARIGEVQKRHCMRGKNDKSELSSDRSDNRLRGGGVCLRQGGRPSTLCCAG